MLYHYILGKIMSREGKALTMSLIDRLRHYWLTGETHTHTDVGYHRILAVIDNDARGTKKWRNLPLARRATRGPCWLKADNGTPVFIELNYPPSDNKGRARKVGPKASLTKWAPTGLFVVKTVTGF